MMGIHRVTGLWPGIIRSMGETNLEVNRLETNLVQIKETEEHSVLQVQGKWVHKTRMSRMEEREHKK